MASTSFCNEGSGNRVAIVVFVLLLLLVCDEHMYGPPTKLAPREGCDKGRCRTVPLSRSGGAASGPSVVRHLRSGGYAHVDKSVVWPHEKEHDLWGRLVQKKCDVDWGPVVDVQLKQWETTGISQTQVDEYCVKKIVRFSFVKNELRASRFQPANKNNHRLASAFWFIKVAAMRARARGNPLPDVRWFARDPCFTGGHVLRRATRCSLLAWCMRPRYI